MIKSETAHIVMASKYLFQVLSDKNHKNQSKRLEFVPNNTVHSLHLVFCSLSLGKLKPKSLHELRHTEHEEDRLQDRSLLHLLCLLSPGLLDP